MEGLGSLAFWGMTPAADLVAGTPAEAASAAEVLLVGSGDPRHVLATLVGARRRGGGHAVHMHVMEGSMAQHARTVLLLALAVEPRAVLGLHDKVAFFVELFGNTLVRAKTGEYLAAKATELMALVTDPARCAAVLPFLDLAALKFRERDDLELLFKAWRLGARDASFDVRCLWDERVRSHLTTRYDARANIADWDYNMKLSEAAPTIHPRQYETWRLTGVAFEPREAEYACPNGTLAGDLPARDAKGTKVLRRGYWGDITTGPYLAFGIASENAALLKRVNNKPTKVSSREHHRALFTSLT
jgi:dynein assembly factor 3